MNAALNASADPAWTSESLKSSGSIFSLGGRSLFLNGLYAIVIYLFYLGVKGKYFHSTSPIPGPSLLHWTMLPALYYYIRGEQWKYVDKLHEKYGPIFRMGSRQIYVSDKEAIRQLLAKENLPKVNWYAGLSRDPKTAGLFTTTNKEYHRQRRRLFSPAFSVEYLKNLDPFLTSATTMLFEAYAKRIRKNGGEMKVNIYEDLACLAMDILGETTLGRSFNLVSCLDDPTADRQFVDINHLLAKYLHDGGIQFFCRPFDKYMKRNLDVYKLTNPLVQDRFSQTDVERKDLLQFLVNACREVQKGQKDLLTQTHVQDQCVELLIAGGETTSNTITYILKALLDNPEKLAKLYETIPTADIDAPVCTIEELRETEYLDACINEGMRMYPVTNELGRRTGKEPTTALGHYIPPRTAVSASLRALHYSPEYWYKPKEYLPERFIPSSDVPDADMGAFMPFGTGPRNCIGWKFAWSEMKLVLYTLLSRYEIYKVEKEVDFRQFVTFQLKEPRFLVGVKVREGKI
ncbi:cytochrome P450 [Violaceomyces palustris]|uniref:Cytochrome P450 n=1 Tax=Violaceomyces palustris TaxID=1673888 RepID=A0ACD0NP66_9BASI|nr:cytochrome P450 [Violaceomyces palustris]